MTELSHLLHEREADIKGRRQLAALDEIEADFENVRTAWQWAAQERNYAAIDRALESLRWFCHIRNRFQEIQVLLDLAQETLAPTQGKQPHPIWGRLQAGAIKVQSSHLELSDTYQNQVKIALAIAQKYGQQFDCAFCLWRLGVIAYRLNKVDEALVYFKESTRYYHSLADDFYLSYVLKDMALLYIRLDLPDKGISLLEQSIDLHSKLGDRVGLAPALGAMGWISYYSTRYAESQAQWQEVQQISTLYGNRTQQLWNLSGQGWKALFTDGDLMTAQTMAQEMQCGGLDLNDLECQHRAQILFGLPAGIQEDYSTCRRAFSNDPNRHPFPYNRAWTLIGLCVAACGLHDAQAIRNNLYKLLEDSHTHHWLANYAIALPFAAVLADNADQPERATELLGLAYHHPLSPKGWLHCWPLLARLKADSFIDNFPSRYDIIQSLIDEKNMPTG